MNKFLKNISHYTARLVHGVGQGVVFAPPAAAAYMFGGPAALVGTALGQAAGFVLMSGQAMTDLHAEKRIGFYLRSFIPVAACAFLVAGLAGPLLPAAVTGLIAGTASVASFGVGGAICLNAHRIPRRLDKPDTAADYNAARLGRIALVLAVGFGAYSYADQVKQFPVIKQIYNRNAAPPSQGPGASGGPSVSSIPSIHTGFQMQRA